MTYDNVNDNDNGSVNDNDNLNDNVNDNIAMKIPHWQKQINVYSESSKKMSNTKCVPNTRMNVKPG